jgi:hypothetical protein
VLCWYLDARNDNGASHSRDPRTCASGELSSTPRIGARPRAARDKAVVGFAIARYGPTSTTMLAMSPRDKTQRQLSQPRSRLTGVLSIQVAGLTDK